MIIFPLSTSLQHIKRIKKMAIGYHISNTKIVEVSFDKLFEGFWITHNLSELLNCGDYCGASIINSKPLW